VMAPDGSVDREKLAGIVFSDKKSLSALTGLLYPGVKSEIRRVFEDAARQGEHEVCVAEVPLLIEDGELDMYDFIVVVRAKYENQLRRFLQRGGTSAADLDRRIANQMDLAEKVKYADAVVENDGSIEETFQQVKDIFQEIRRRKRRFPGGSSGNSSDGDLGDTSNKGKKSRRDSFLYQRR
jgi:dephospho-CoA kinase